MKVKIDSDQKCLERLEERVKVLLCLLLEQSLTMGSLEQNIEQAKASDHYFNPNIEKYAADVVQRLED
jgi:hypothetical protein